MRLPHIVGSFDRELQDLARRIAAMGGLAEHMVEEAVAALLASDPERAARVIRDDEHLDAGERLIDEKALLLIARRQPAASDLHEIVGAIRIAADLERVGDLAKNIAKRVAAVGLGHQPPAIERGVQALAERVLNQLNDVLDAYGTRAPGRLDGLEERDRETDSAFASLFGAMLAHMTAAPRDITASTHLLFCIKNIERIGDHAAAIAETVRGLVTGDPPPAADMPPEAADRSKFETVGR